MGGHAKTSTPHVSLVDGHVCVTDCIFHPHPNPLYNINTNPMSDYCTMQICIARTCCRKMAGWIEWCHTSVLSLNG